MSAYPEGWWYCLADPEDAASRLILDVYNTATLIVSRLEYDGTWLLHGGVIDSYRYNFALLWFHLTLATVPDGGTGTIDVYLIDPVYWSVVKGRMIDLPYDSCYTLPWGGVWSE